MLPSMLRAVAARTAVVGRRRAVAAAASMRQQQAAMLSQQHTNTWQPHRRSLMRFMSTTPVDGTDEDATADPSTASPSDGVAAQAQAAAATAATEGTITAADAAGTGGDLATSEENELENATDATAAAGDDDDAAGVDDYVEDMKPSEVSSDSVCGLLGGFVYFRLATGGQRGWQCASGNDRFRTHGVDAG